MRIAVCDDDSVYLQELAELLKAFFNEIQMQYDIKTFVRGAEILKACDTEGFDVVLLDIAMPGQDGFSVAETLMENHPELILVFVSGNESMVFESYAYNPLWFVPKSQPLYLKRALKEVVERYRRQKSQNAVVNLRVEKNKIISIEPKHLLYIGTTGHYASFVFTEEEKTKSYRCKLDDLEAQLVSHGFVRIHKRFLVNCSFISEIKGQKCILHNEQELPISRGNMADAKKSFHDYLRSVR